MSALIYDVIIIGAGPAGSSCALNLKLLNPKLSILLLDKQPFPRYKPCGGGVSPEVINYLPIHHSEFIDFLCTKITLVADNKKVTDTDHTMWMVRREHFDDFLVQKATERGVETDIPCEVYDVIQDKESIQIVTSTNTFVCKYAVLAEGGHGKLAQKLGLPINHRVFAAMEYEHYCQAPDEELEINLDKHPHGYAWRFPKSDGLSVGIGAYIKHKSSKAHKKLPAMLQEYLKEFGIHSIDKTNLHGHPIQVYSGRTKLHYQRLILIGEIAGCVDPLTGEGIRPAIKSAYLAAQALYKAISHNRPSMLRSYQRQFGRQIGKELNLASILLWIKTRLGTYFLQSMSPNRLDKMLRIFTGTDTYWSLISWKRFVKVFKLMFKNA